MNRIVQNFAIVIFLLFGVVLQAQHQSQLALKVASSGAFHTKYKMGIEWRPAKNIIFELTGAYRRYNQLGKDVFSGKVVNEYAIEEAFRTTFSASFASINYVWQYKGDGRPMYYPKEISRTPLSTTRITLGFKKNYTLSKLINCFAEPAISGALFQQYEVGALEKTVEKQTAQSWNTSPDPDQQMVVKTTYYTDTQSSLVRKYYLAGPAVLLGFSVQAQKGFLLELRGSAGINLGKSLNGLPQNIGELRYGYAQFDVLIGYRFGI